MDILEWSHWKATKILRSWSIPHARRVWGSSGCLVWRRLMGFLSMYKNTWWKGLKKMKAGCPHWYWMKYNVKYRKNNLNIRCFVCFTARHWHRLPWEAVWVFFGDIQKPSGCGLGQLAPGDRALSSMVQAISRYACQLWSLCNRYTSSGSGNLKLP